MAKEESKASLLSVDIDEDGDRKEQEEPPFSGLAYFIILFMGFGMLVPWNILLNS